MAPRKKKLVPVTTFTRHGFSGIAALPTELFDEICGKYLRPIDVLNLGCVDKRLAFLTTRTSRIWTIFRDALGYPQIPISLRDQISDKQVIVLVSKVGCAFCPAKTRNVMWRVMKRVCARCHGKSYSGSITMASDKNFLEWTRQMDRAKFDSQGNRKNQLAQLRAQRRAQIIERFATMTPVPIPLAILNQCGSFRKACDVPALLTARSFTNVLRTLTPEIQAVRIRAEIQTRFTVLRNLAMEGLPEPWTTDQDPFGMLTTEATQFKHAFSEQIRPTLETYAWNEAFSAFDPLPHLDEAKTLFCLPFQVYTESMAQVHAEFPHLEEHLAETQLKNAKFFVHRHGVNAKEAFLQEIERRVQRERMLLLFPSNRPIGGGLYSGRIGAEEWFSRNLDVVGYKNAQWDLEVVKQGAEGWQNIVTVRIANVYRRIHAQSCEQVRSMRMMREHDLLEVQQLPELALLADLPILGVHNVHHHLRKITNVFSFEDRPSISACRKALTAEQFDEDEAFRLIAHEFNRSVSLIRMFAVGLHATSDIFAAFLSLIGVDYTQEFDGEAQRGPFFEWRKEFETRVEAVVNEGVARFENFGACERNFALAVDLLVDDVSKENAVLEGILPGKVLEFDVKEFVDLHEEWLKKWADSNQDALYEPDEYDSEDDDGCCLM
ncbi:hypothetical protein HDU98_005259 [Podochytrium sp. JEL0797]|nr:hypothetical protein HDU98_005259 [Podochytrium sp. JEL0797]